MVIGYADGTTATVIEHLKGFQVEQATEMFWLLVMGTFVGFVIIGLYTIIRRHITESKW